MPWCRRGPCDLAPLAGASHHTQKNDVRPIRSIVLAYWPDYDTVKQVENGTATIVKLFHTTTPQITFGQLITNGKEEHKRTTDLYYIWRGSKQLLSKWCTELEHVDRLK